MTNPMRKALVCLMALEGNGRGRRRFLRAEDLEALDGRSVQALKRRKIIRRIKGAANAWRIDRDRVVQRDSKS